ncbi:hypothetical protein GQ457_01G025780 [Hibiscus cannabinus]
MFEIAAGYFSKLFVTANGNISAQIMLAIDMRITPEMNNDLKRYFTKEEVESAFFEINPTKAPVNKLKPILHVCINDNQGAFVPGRLISDNILIAHENFHALKSLKYGPKSGVALKLDMEKAYNKVEWNFLNEIMIKMGFDEVFVKLIMKCISIVTYHVRINDDSLVFIRNTANEANRLKDVLRIYEEGFGQKINVNKSSIYFFPNISEEGKLHVKNIMGIQEVENPEIYLGIPMIVGKTRLMGSNFCETNF